MSERASKVSKKVAKAKGKTKKIGKKTKTGRNKRAVKGKGRATKAGKVVKREVELEPITPFRRGLSIGVKFAGLTACVVGLFMALLGYLTYSITAREMDAQIKDQGVSIVNSIEKTIDRSFWIAMEEVGIGDDPEKPRPPKPQQSDEELQLDWDTRLKGIVDDSKGQIVAVSVVNQKKLDANTQILVAGTALSLAQSHIGCACACNKAPRPVGLRNHETHKEHERHIDIYEGRLSGTNERVRRFDKKISLASHLDKERNERIERAIVVLEDTDPESDGWKQALTEIQTLSGDRTIETAQDARDWRNDTPMKFLREEFQEFVPKLSVFIKADRLDKIKAALWKRISLVTLCGAGAGILLTVLIAAVLTGPIRELEGDITEVAEGNLDHQSRVNVKDEIGALAHVFNIMTRNLKIAQANAVERQAFERELNIAKEIQEKLLPERIPQIPGLDIHSHYKAAKEVGGDYYDFIVIDQTHLGIIMADVAGKGIPGAMVMTMVRSLVRLASVRNVSPGDTFKKVNRILAKDIRRGMFVTAAYMVLNVKTKTLRVASAGHNPIVLYRAKTGENELIKPAGIALGFDKGTIFDNHIKEVEVQLEPGDRIVTYTDGVNEAMNNDSEEFGDERFYELVKTHATKSSKDFVAAIVSALDEHRGTAEQSDDITITTLSVHAGGAKS